MIKKYLDFNEAVLKSLQMAKEIRLNEIVSLGDCLGRIISKDI